MRSKNLETHCVRYSAFHDILATHKRTRDSTRVHRVHSGLHTQEACASGFLPSGCHSKLGELPNVEASTMPRRAVVPQCDACKRELGGGNCPGASHSPSPISLPRCSLNPKLAGHTETRSPTKENGNYQAQSRQNRRKS